MSEAKGSARAVELRRSATLMRRMLLGLKGRLDDELRSRHVSSAQLRLLREIKERPGSSGAEMARACYVTPQSAQAMLARAEKHGWVVRGTDLRNGRLRTVRLTPPGERLLAYADEVFAAIEADVWAGVSVADLKRMNAVLERGLHNLE